MKPTRHIKHTDLFIVRVWTQDRDNQPGNSGHVASWRGKVQRVVDGEAHEFGSWQALIDTLQAMLSADAHRSSVAAQASQIPTPNEKEDKNENNQSH